MKGVVRSFLREHLNVVAGLDVGGDVGALVLDLAGALGIDAAKHHVEHAAEGHH